MNPPTDSLPTAQVDPAGAIQSARAVFFDFDGPLCDVFSSYPAAEVAEELKQVAEDSGVRLPDGLASSSDPHGILLGVRLAGLRSDGTEHGRSLCAALEERLAQLETVAARSAEPTACASELVSALRAQGTKALVTSNNAEGAVWAHLQAEGIDGLFDHVVGRNPRDPLLMKPDPHCVNRALELVGLLPEDCVLIGDQPTDVQAARAAGVPFLGYAPDETHVAALRAVRAGGVVASLGALKALLPLS